MCQSNVLQKKKTKQPDPSSIPAITQKEEVSDGSHVGDAYEGVFVFASVNCKGMRVRHMVKSDEERLFFMRILNGEPERLCRYTQLLACGKAAVCQRQKADAFAQELIQQEEKEKEKAEQRVNKKVCHVCARARHFVCVRVCVQLHSLPRDSRAAARYLCTGLQNLTARPFTCVYKQQNNTIHVSITHTYTHDSLTQRSSTISALGHYPSTRPRRPPSPPPSTRRHRYCPPPIHHASTRPHFHRHHRQCGMSCRI